MSYAENIRKSIEDFNRHDATAFAASYAPDAVVYDPYYSEPLRGRAAIQKDIEAFFTAFPDIRISARTALEEGNVVALQASVTGTHKGPLPLPTGEIPATGKKLTFDGGHFSRFNTEGLVVEEHRYYDVLGQLVQLGIAPEQVGV